MFIDFIRSKFTAADFAWCSVIILGGIFWRLIVRIFWWSCMHYRCSNSLRWGIRYSGFRFVSKRISVSISITSVTGRRLLLFLILLWCSSRHSLLWGFPRWRLSILNHRLVRVSRSSESRIILLLISIVSSVWTLVHIRIILRVYWPGLWLLAVIIPSLLLFSLSLLLSLLLDVPSWGCFSNWLILLRRLFLRHRPLASWFPGTTKCHIIHLINIRWVLGVVVDLRFKYFSVISILAIGVGSVSAVVSRVSSSWAIFIQRLSTLWSRRLRHVIKLSR